jgi:hypothetical protein
VLFKFSVKKSECKTFIRLKKRIFEEAYSSDWTFNWEGVLLSPISPSALFRKPESVGRGQVKEAVLRVANVKTFSWLRSFPDAGTRRKGRRKFQKNLAHRPITDTRSVNDKSFQNSRPHEGSAYKWLRHWNCACFVDHGLDFRPYSDILSIFWSEKRPLRRVWCSKSVFVLPSPSKLSARRFKSKGADQFGGSHTWLNTVSWKQKNRNSFSKVGRFVLELWFSDSRRFVFALKEMEIWPWFTISDHCTTAIRRITPPSVAPSRTFKATFCFLLVSVTKIVWSLNWIVKLLDVSMSASWPCYDDQHNFATIGYRSSGWSAHLP